MSFVRGPGRGSGSSSNVGIALGVAGSPGRSSPAGRGWTPGSASRPGRAGRRPAPGPRCRRVSAAARVWHWPQSWVKISFAVAQGRRLRCQARLRRCRRTPPRPRVAAGHDVGRHVDLVVARVVRRDRARVLDLGLDDALDRVLVHAVGAGGGERGVEIGADRGRRARLGQRVAGAAVVDEQRPAALGVRVLLEVAASRTPPARRAVAVTRIALPRAAFHGFAHARILSVAGADSTRAGCAWRGRFDTVRADPH